MGTWQVDGPGRKINSKGEETRNNEYKQANAVHGSDAPETAVAEIEFFFSYLEEV